MNKIKIINGKLIKVEIKNYGILDKVDTSLSRFNVILGKNKIGKTTFINALKCLESFITNDVSIDYINFYRMLRKIDRKDNSSVEFFVEFQLETEPNDFSGQYSYMVAVNLDAIQKEVLKAEGLPILVEKGISEVTLVDRNLNSLKYYRMIKEGGIYNCEFEERAISSINKLSTSLLWDESREPYMDVVRNFLKEIGGLELKFTVESKPKLIDGRYGDIEFEDGVDFISLVFHYLEHRNKKIIEKLNYFFSLIYEDFIEFGIPEEDYADIAYMVEKIRNKEIKIPAYYISEGTKRLIYILSKCLLAESYGMNKIVIIDEIENSLHPKIIEKFLEILKEIDIQLIITTHSPVVLKYLEESDIKIMYRDKTGIKMSQGYNKKTLAEDFDISIDELDIMGIWIDGDDSDLIVNKQ